MQQTKYKVLSKEWTCQESLWMRPKWRSAAIKLTQLNRQGPIRGNTTRSPCLSKCFTINVQRKVNSYKERKNNSYNTDKLPKGHCKNEIKENDENEAAYQMLRITRVGG